MAARLGVAPGTVRSWGRRYGLTPAGRTPGGHRRFTLDDLKMLTLMQDLVGSGVSPASAAGRALQAMSSVRSDAPSVIGSPVFERRRRLGGPGGRVISVPNGNAQARGLARIASRLDADAAMGQLADQLLDQGVVRTWEDVLLPVLAAIGSQWSRTGGDVEVEHVMTEATVDALRAYRSFLPRPAPNRPVLLACSATDMHTLPLHALAAGLTERRFPSRMLGARVPSIALASAARRTGAGAVFIWRQIVGIGDELDDLAMVLAARSSMTVVVGGPGWSGVDLPERVHRAFTLGGAMDECTKLSR